jgi:hypothetical protein
MKFAILAFVASCVLSQAYGAEDDIVLDASGPPLRVGVYSRYGDFQRNLRERIIACKLLPTTPEDQLGTFGPSTTKEISALNSCKKHLENSTPNVGKLTVAVWREIMGTSALPSVEERADVLTLTFEATDFTDPPEWNFCQDNSGPAEERAQRAMATSTCFNETDPCSLLTWGPRGATAGQGREIQRILQRVGESDSAAIDRSFGAEARNVRRFVGLSGPEPDSCDGSSALEHFMCAIWIDSDRRQLWTHGFQLLGADPGVRAIYRGLYRSYPFDGEKLERYGRLWAQLSLVPSEVDFAFFYDRATQIGGPPDDDPALAGEIKSCIRADTLTANIHAAARRCLSLRHPHPTLPTDRLGRDVSYYIDAYPQSALSPKELTTWHGFIPLSAVKTVGLSDARDYSGGAAIDSDDQIDEQNIGESNELTPIEVQCPLFIRAPRHHLLGTP